MPKPFAHARFLLVLAIVSCNAQNPADSQTRTPPEELQRETPDIDRIDRTDRQVDASLVEFVDMARADLEQRLSEQGLDTEIHVLRAERVTWRSGALGCPMPDRGYTMALVPGVLIQLRAAGRLWQYHSSERVDPFLCEPPGEIESPAPRNDSRDPT